MFLWFCLKIGQLKIQPPTYGKNIIQQFRPLKNFQAARRMNAHRSTSASGRRPRPKGSCSTTGNPMEIPWKIPVATIGSMGVCCEFALQLIIFLVFTAKTENIAAALRIKFLVTCGNPMPWLTICTHDGTGIAEDHPKNHYWLVVSTHLKNMKVSWDSYSQHMEK